MVTSVNPRLGTLKIDEGTFTFHLYPSKASKKTIVFIPGLMEPKAGYCYLGHKIASFFLPLNVSTILFDLAGQGDSTLSLSIKNWKQQIKAISEYLALQEITFIGRGFGAYIPFFLTPQTPLLLNTIALSPPNLDCLAVDSLPPRFFVSPLTESCVTPLDPSNLSIEEKLFWYSMGAEVECLGSLEVSKSFFLEIQKVIPTLKARWKGFCQIYDPIKKDFPGTWASDFQKTHPLFNKQREREALCKDLQNYVL